MSSVDQSLKSIAQRVGRLDLLIDPSNPNSLREAQETLNGIINELQIISSAKDSELSQNEMLVINEIDELLNHTIVLKQQIDSTISENQDLYNAINKHSSINTNASEESIDRPLNQEEIRKLLMLVAQAQSMNILTVNQKSLLKDQIVRRQSFLRLILVDDITVILSSMKEIASHLESR